MGENNEDKHEAGRGHNETKRGRSPSMTMSQKRGDRRTRGGLLLRTVFFTRCRFALNDRRRAREVDRAFSASGINLRFLGA